jgi:hypothetical protein
MPETFKLRILVPDRPACQIDLEAPLELGCQRAGEPSPYQCLPASDEAPARLVIAPQQDRHNISHRHLTLAPLSDGFRSALAVDSLRQMEYTNAMSMDGGIRDWRNRGYPLTSE